MSWKCRLYFMYLKARSVRMHDRCVLTDSFSWLVNLLYSQDLINSINVITLDLVNDFRQFSQHTFWPGWIFVLNLHYFLSKWREVKNYHFVFLLCMNQVNSLTFFSSKMWQINALVLNFDAWPMHFSQWASFIRHIKIYVSVCINFYLKRDLQKYIHHYYL